MLNINRRNYKEAILELNNNMFTCKNTDVLDKLQDIRMLFQEESKCNTLLAAIIALNEKKITGLSDISSGVMNSYLNEIVNILGKRDYFNCIDMETFKSRYSSFNYLHILKEVKPIDSDVYLPNIIVSKDMVIGNNTYELMGLCSIFSLDEVLKMHILVLHMYINSTPR